MDLKIRVYCGLLTVFFAAVYHVQGKESIACAKMLTSYLERPKKLEIIKFSYTVHSTHPLTRHCPVVILTHGDIFASN